MKKTRKESVPNIALDSGLTNRLNRNQQAIARDETQRLFDPQARDSLLFYVKGYSSELNDTLSYLQFLTNAKGERYCRSSGRYSDIEAQLDNFAAKEKGSFMWNVHMQRAVERVKEDFSGAHLSMLNYQTLSDVEDAVTDWDTSMGWTGIVTGRTKKYMYCSDELLPSLLAKESAAKVNGSFATPIVPWFRTQGSGAFNEDGSLWGVQTHTWKSKKRLVCMVDGWVVMSESRFGKPLTEYMSIEKHTGIGKDDQWFVNWIRNQRLDGKNFISLDYSKYDSTIPSWLIHQAFEVIRSMFTDYDARLLKVIEHDFIHKDVYGGRGLEHFDHGNPSGSRLTTIINCICNMIVTETWADALHIDVEYNVMGDDNLIYTTHSVDSSLVESIGQYIEHNFGIKCNVDKDCFGKASEDPKFLSRYWSSAGAHRPAGELVAMICYPEKSRQSAYESGVLTPAVLLYSYCLAYPVTMSKLVNVAQIAHDAKVHVASIGFDRRVREELPYNVRLALENSTDFQYYKRRKLAKLKTESRSN